MRERTEIEKQARTRLEAERKTLQHASDETAGTRAPVTLDQQSVGRLSRMDAMQTQEMAKSQEVRRRMRVQQIDAALRRLDDGEYGCCVNCGEDISAKRLAIDPVAARCIDCAG